ncbi:hypothetical protein Hanom_Chr15g01342761 [Helianthus anomalus]
MQLYMIYIILCHSDHFVGIGIDGFLFTLYYVQMMLYVISILFDLVCWHVVRFGVEGLSGSSLSIPRDRGKVCLHPTLPRPYK